MDNSDEIRVPRPLGTALLQWHGGQGSMLYAVGSHSIAGHPVDRLYVEDCTQELEMLAQAEGAEDEQNEADLRKYAKDLCGLLDKADYQIETLGILVQDMLVQVVPTAPYRLKIWYGGRQAQWGEDMWSAELLNHTGKVFRVAHNFVVQGGEDGVTATIHDILETFIRGRGWGGRPEQYTQFTRDELRDWNRDQFLLVDLLEFGFKTIPWNEKTCAQALRLHMHDDKADFDEKTGHWIWQFAEDEISGVIHNFTKTKDDKWIEDETFANVHDLAGAVDEAEAGHSIVEGGWLEAAKKYLKEKDYGRSK